MELSDLKVFMGEIGLLFGGFKNSEEVQNIWHKKLMFVSYDAARKALDSYGFDGNGRAPNVFDILTRSGARKGKTDSHKADQTKLRNIMKQYLARGLAPLVTDYGNRLAIEFCHLEKAQRSGQPKEILLYGEMTTCYVAEPQYLEEEATQWEN